jgi:tellurite resistance protein
MTPNELEAYDAMMHDRDRWRERADTMFAKHAKILDEARNKRDEAREQRDRLDDQLDQTILRLGETQERMIDAERQRDKLAEAVNAATVLIAAKGRHNTMLAYEGLRKALATTNQPNL